MAYVLFTSMATLIKIKLHTFMKKSCFLSLDAKRPPNILGTPRLLNSCEMEYHAPFHLRIYGVKNNTRRALRILGKEWHQQEKQPKK